ncbi:aspartate ammonia-lyase [Ancylobacter aquaticus]|uniref:Aspartate ammonia-lyase n=1 Tax=Ancylobacter aquaticus TaxID=100 RepID=A0A4R1HYZ4_ANCAQ|nr:aspartate ammonia-lyase [Ancylobacter aquaticus]TCK28037.1 aspartate ammonia-lyase [Ancylobacter aquaticus]
MPNTRTDTDSLGSRHLPQEALYGISTLRGGENFDISFHKLGHEPALLRALARIKHAAAAANAEIGVLPVDLAEVIIAAAVEVVEGRHGEQFIVDLMEGSGGTSINMNVNEVLANRALQLLGGQPGDYARLHPNDHVNMGQSTNDVVPAAVKLAVYDTSQALVAALVHLAEAFDQRAVAFDDVLRLGRTCMQAGQPMRLGQAFRGYASAIRRIASSLGRARDEMLVLPLGGTAIGTGFGSASGYRGAVYRHLSRLVGAPVRQSDDLFDAMQNADAFARVSSEIRIGAEVIGKIASDLVILSSDGQAGLGELKLPSVQPGSSIMPGKVNPVLPMMMQQVAFAVVGNDAAISLACLNGQLEINHFEPVIASRLLGSIDLLARSTRIFADRCIAGIEADRERSLGNLMRSPALATLFVPSLGYTEVSKLVQLAATENRSFIELVIERGLLSHDDVLRSLRDSTEYREEAV